jgi:plasmid stabilization system protein ParE
MRLEILTTAAQAIVEQADYYELKSGHVLAARWEAAVDEAVDRLLRWPETGAPVRFRSPQLAGLRWVAVPGFPKHLIFYRYLPDVDLLRVIQVLHGARPSG